MKNNENKMTLILLFSVCFSTQMAMGAMNQSIDFREVDDERRRVIQELTQVLNESEVSDLLSKSLAYRTGQISFGTYYRELRVTCERHGISLFQTPAFEEYIQTVLLSDNIKADKLFESVQNTEQKILEKLIKAPEENNSAELSEFLMLAEKLIDFAFTPDEWKKHFEQKRSLHNLS